MTQTIVSFQTAINTFDIKRDYVNYCAHQDKHFKTYILRGNWKPEKAIAKAKRAGAVDGTITVTHAEIYAAKAWQRFEETAVKA